MLPVSLFVFYGFMKPDTNSYHNWFYHGCGHRASEMGPAGSFYGSATVMQCLFLLGFSPLYVGTGTYCIMSSARYRQGLCLCHTVTTFASTSDMYRQAATSAGDTPKSMSHTLLPASRDLLLISNPSLYFE